MGTNSFLSLVCEKDLVENSKHADFLFLEECNGVDGDGLVLRVEYVTEPLCIGHCFCLTLPCVKLVVMLE